MVYISPDGAVHNTQPWNVRRVTDMFWAFVGVVWFFLQSITEPLTSLSSGGNNGGGGSGSSFRNSRGGGGGGGGGGFFGGGGGGGRGPPGPSNRRIGRINTAPSCSVPGGCCGQ